MKKVLAALVLLLALCGCDPRAKTGDYRVTERQDGTFVVENCNVNLWPHPFWSDEGTYKTLEEACAAMRVLEAERDARRRSNTVSRVRDCVDEL